MANELFNFSEAQKRDIIRYVAEQLANIPFDSEDFTATTVAEALQELFDTKADA